MKQKEYFLTTSRIGFALWSDSDIDPAESLWGDPEVTRYICASGRFSEVEVQERLHREINEQRKSNVQYWPIYNLEDGDLVGCCGLHPHDEKIYELGFHLRPKYWHKGYASEATNAVISYAFDVLQIEALFAGHNPKNTATERVLKKLGFQYTGHEFYEPTGLFHPSYRLSISSNLRSLQ